MDDSERLEVEAQDARDPEDVAPTFDPTEVADE